MRSWLVLILALLSVAAVDARRAGAAWAQAPESPAERREQVAAATEAAIGALRESIGRQSIGRDATVDTFLGATGGDEQFLAALRRAELLGGPRWLDDQTCQVRLEIGGGHVARSLLRIAAENPRKSPVPPEALAVRIVEWDRRTFSSTGTSTGAAEIEDLRPADESPAWQGVSDEARRRAVADAKRDAVRQAIESVRTVSLPGGAAVGDVLAAPAVREKVEAWLATRPVTEVSFRDDLKVNVQLAAPPAEFVEAVRASVGAREADEAAWHVVRAEFERRVGGPVGEASVERSANATAVATEPVEPSQVVALAADLPAVPPAWTNDQVDAEGAAPWTGSKLKAARAAEADALGKVAAQIEALPLSRGRTLGDAAQSNLEVRRAIDRAVGRARTFKVDYRPDEVRVRVALDLRDVWQELSAVP